MKFIFSLNCFTAIVISLPVIFPAPASRLSPNGCCQTGCNSTRVRRRSSRWRRRSDYRLHQLPSEPLTVDGQMVTRVSSVENLSVFIDSDLIVPTHARALSRQLRQIRRSTVAAASAIQTLNDAVVVNRLDYGTSTVITALWLHGLPAYLVCRLQSVLNTSACLI